MAGHATNFSYEFTIAQPLILFARCKLEQLLPSESQLPTSKYCGILNWWETKLANCRSNLLGARAGTPGRMLLKPL